MSNTAIERVLSKLPDAKRNGKGWSARCPAHEDRHPSLSIATGDDGRALVNCHAGCSVEAICEAVGLRVADLMPGDNADVDTTSQKPRKKRPSATSTPGNNDGQCEFQTARDAVAELERQLGKRSALWTYHDAQGKPVGVVVRWTRGGGKKEIRPVSRHGDGWRFEGMAEPRPLYALSDLAGTGRVYVCEGEKSADAARSLGVTATTSAHGCQSAKKTDWQPLAGREVILLPDNDAPGRKYAEVVATLLANLTPAPVVKVVELPGLPEKGDIADWIDAHGDAAEPDELRATIECMADSAEAVESVQTAAHIKRFEPFPTDALPEPVRGFVEAGAKAIGCDPSYLALPMLTALGAAIGNTRRIQLKRGWTAPAIIWAAIVGESGTAKTPAFKLVMRPIRQRQREAMERHAEDAKEHEADLARWEKVMAAWKRDTKGSDDPPEKPEAPQAERFVVSDTTVEALAPLLLANPRGLLLARDELAGWIGSFDRYAGGKGGADAAHWLSMHNGESIIVDRKTGNPRTIFVPQASVCVCGGIQPTILHRALGTEHRESGLAARLVLACPPRLAKRWTEADIDPAAEEKIARLVDRLYELQPTVGDQGDPRPVVIGLTADAKTAWKAYYNAHAQEQADLSGELSAAWSKLEEYAARLALVIHFSRWAADDPTLASVDAVDPGSMGAGVQLATWFKGEARRVYALMGESDDDRDQRRLIEWIQRKGGPVTAREVQMGCRWLREAGAAESALDQLVKDGLGQWDDVPPGSKGGRPSSVFRLLTSTKPHKTWDSEGFVDVDTVDAAETQPDDDWGVI
jgi:hypothetical protein